MIIIIMVNNNNHMVRVPKPSRCRMSEMVINTKRRSLSTALQFWKLRKTLLEPVGRCHNNTKQLKEIFR